MMIKSSQSSIKKGETIGAIIGIVIGLFICYYITINNYFGDLRVDEMIFNSESMFI